MKCILYILIVLAGLGFSVRTAAEETPSLKDLGKMITNSYLDIKWVNDRYFTYQPVEDGTRVYYLVDSKTWKQIKMFDNKEFAASLNKISKGGQNQMTFV